MMGVKLGFIGYGNMARALVLGLIEAEALAVSAVRVTDVDAQKKAQAEADFGGSVARDNVDVARFANYLVIAVKPDHYQGVIDEIKDVLEPGDVVISIAAGLTLETLEGYFGRAVKLVRTMPNTPALCREGMTALIPNAHIEAEALGQVERLFAHLGRVQIIDEGLIEAAIVTSGSAPAYLYLMMEAMIQGGMKEGMSREMATTFVSQAVIGAGKMVATTHTSPMDLCDAVCSPNGTTIEAVKHLQAQNFGETVQNAMAACAKRSREMSEK